MSGQAWRWGLAFGMTATLAASVVVSAIQAPAPAVAETVTRRDPAGVSAVELELILTKIREGDLLWMNKDLPGAQRAWQAARRMGEGLWPIHEGLGDSYARAKRSDDALREYRLAEPLVPDKFAAMRQAIVAKRAAVLDAAGRSLEALQIYLELNQPSQYGTRILTSAMASDPAAALKAMERHAELYDPRIFYLVSGLHARLGHKAESAEALAQYAIRVAPWDEPVNRRAIDALRELGRFDPALEVCRAWIKALPQSFDAYEAMGDVLWQAGRERESLVACSSIVDLRPGDAVAHRRLGEIYERRNRPEEAFAQFEQALKLAPKDADLKSRLSRVYQSRLARLQSEGKRDEARAIRKRLGEFGVQEAGLFDVKIVMTWDAMTDVDLDIYEPDGTRINHQNRVSKIGGTYYADNTTGLGPETYTLSNAPKGTYRIGAHLHKGSKSVVKLTVILFEDTPVEERREATLTLEVVGETPVFIPDLVIP